MAKASNQSHFATVPRADIPRAKFKRDNNLHTTMNAGDLVPIFLDEVVPADTFIMRENLFGRLATPLRPVMDNLYVETFYFFVPSRLVMDNWVKLHGEQKNPGDSTSYLVPQIVINNVANGTLSDYFGLPTKIAQNISVNALPFRCYNLIYNEWFRDQNLQNSVVVDTDDGPDLISDYTLLKRGKKHDYFTSCLPSPQKGPAVPLPLGTTAPVITNSQTPTMSGGGLTNQTLVSSAGTTTINRNGGNAPSTAGLIWGSQTGMVTDLSTATAATINSIREAFQVQRLYERDMRGGTRYTEILRSHFGVISPDQRLQRPEYLGGSSSRVGISPVANTSDTATAKQGDLAGVGTVASTSGHWTYSATEHGYIIGLACLRADINYQQGLNKLWSRSTRFDFYYPVLSHLGEQAVLNKEIYATGTATDSQVFGYQERYAEYKYKPNLVTGVFRSNDAASLDSWHLADKYAALPVLNSSFIQVNPPMARILAVPSQPHLILDCYFDLDCVRPMPMYSVPGLIDHF